jgi:membrane-bound inhibitor of C-type lysozyme
MNDSHKGIWAILAIILLVVLAIALVYAFSGSSQQPTPQPETSTTQNIQTIFACDGGKSINAVFMNATTATTTGNSVQLALSDGRQMTLAQAISADGARYANQDESFVFWNKGNGAFITEDGTTTYDNCVTQT